MVSAVAFTAVNRNMTSADALIAAIDDTPFDEDQKALISTGREEGREEGIRIGEARGEAGGEKKSLLNVALKMRLRGDSMNDHPLHLALANPKPTDEYE